MTTDAGLEIGVGSELELDVGAPAHGGSCVGHAPDGRVVFIRHALPGERVTARVTEAKSSFLRADAVAILVAAPDRVRPPCRFAGPGRCGGCDLQHVAPAAQLAWKAAVVHEQLARLAGLDVDVHVEALPDITGPGLGWRTRVGFAVDRAGRAGLHAHHSHRLVPVDHCLIAHPQVDAAQVTARRWPGAAAVEVAVSAAGELRIRPRAAEPAPTPAGRPAAAGRRPGGRQAQALRAQGPGVLHERALGRTYQVTGGGFWQVHPAAAGALAAAVLELCAPRPGEHVLDLYSGAGLFAGALAGLEVSVTLVESDRRAAADAQANLPGADVRCAPVDRALADGGLSADIVVLDPPRAGAGPAVVGAIAALAPRAIAYVACDPAPLARDLATFATAGYRLHQLRAFDCFPMTHHVECVALLVPA